MTETGGKKRLILQAFALNHHTASPVFPDGAPAFRRPHIFQFAKELAKKGQGAWMWKRDLSSYYLQIPIDPKDYPKLRSGSQFSNDDNDLSQFHLARRPLLLPNLHLGSEASKQQCSES